MTFRPQTRLVGLVLSSIVWLAASHSGKAQTNPSTPKTETAPKGSVVHGRVIYEDTRRPLRRVQVDIYDPAAKNNLRPFFTWTDGQGEFQIKNVPAGKYFVVVNAPGIIRNGPYSSESKDESFTTVTVNGQSPADVVVRVKRGAAISGRVTYADGDPAIEATIKVMCRKDGKWTSVSVGSGSQDRVVTDDRGVYRVSGLIPGDYILGAAEQKWGIELTTQDRPDGTNFLNRAVLPATWYNGASSLGGATPITLQAGDEQKDIDIVLADRPVHSISGTITSGGNSRPVARARISLTRKTETPGLETSDLDDPVTNSDEGGRFSFEEVTDGNYRIIVSPPRSYSRSQDFPTGKELGQRYVPKTIDVTVSGANLIDLSIEVSSGSRVSGTVAVEGGKPLPPQLLVTVTNGKPNTEDTPFVKVEADGSFSIEGVPPGLGYVRISQPLERNYYTKSVSVGKTDLQRGPLLVKDGEDITNVRVLISPDVAILSGRALAADAKTPQGGMSVVLVPTDPEDQKANYQVAGITNGDGGFRLIAAPGEYLAMVLPRGEYPYQLQAEALKIRFPNAQRVVLQPGENPKVELIPPKQ
jgi:hypothetical protein